jgi:RNA polymerase sigma factor (sigma-70 family)
MQDAELVKAIATGDAGALNALYARHGLALLNLLIGELRDRTQAEEALQNVMLAVWQGAASFRGDSQVRTWLIAIAKRQAGRMLRGQPQLSELNEETLSAPPEEGHSALVEALAHLPYEQQEALEMVYYRGLTIHEAATHLQIPPNTLKSRLHRARAALRKLLTEA